MASGRLFLPGWMPARDSDGAPIPNVRAYFYQSGTDVLASIYADEALSVPLTNPVEANSSGRFPQIYASDAITYSASVDAPYGPAGQPFTFDGLEASQAADIAAANLAQGAAEDAEAALVATQAAIEAATQAGGGEAAVAGALAGQAAADAVVAGKADVDGGNIPDAEAFRVAIDANYIKRNSSPDPTRAWAEIVVPNDGGIYDNVLSIRNECKASGTSWNGVISLQDSNGLEKGAMGYSRNGSIAPLSGYYSDLVFMSCGNPFSTDGNPSDFGVTVEYAAGSAFWGGAFVSYFPIRISSQTGEMEFSTNGGIAGGQINFKDDTRVGTLMTPRVLAFAMSTTYARCRERGAADTFSLTTNIADPQSGASPTPDNTAIPPWEMRMGGALDRMSFGRWGAGLGASYAEIFGSDSAHFYIGQTAPSAGADGRLAVTGGANPAITAKVVGNSAQPAIIAYNDGASGNQSLVTFATDATYTARGSIAYNRAGGVIAYNTTSDERSKVVEADVDGADALARILSVRIVQARMKGGATQSINTVLAHELQEVFPSAVSGERGAVDAEGAPIMQQVDFSKLIPDLVAAIQYLAMEKNHEID